MDVQFGEHVDASDFGAIRELVRQLSSSASLPSDEQIASLAFCSPTFFVVARIDGTIVGMTSLATFATPTGVRAWIEDVVVLDVYRGQGIASGLIEYAIARAQQERARTIDLTSRPDRESANRLYQRLGFVKRETNVYRFSLNAT